MYYWPATAQKGQNAFFFFPLQCAIRLHYCWTRPLWHTPELASDQGGEARARDR